MQKQKPKYSIKNKSISYIIVLLIINQQKT